MKALKKYTDSQLVQELQRRGNIVNIWSIDDVNQAIDDLKEYDDNGEYEGLELTEKEKTDILFELFADMSKENNSLQDAVASKLQSKKTTK